MIEETQNKVNWRDYYVADGEPMTLEKRALDPIQVELLGHENHREISLKYPGFTPQYADLYKVRLKQMEDLFTSERETGTKQVQLSKMREGDMCWVTGCLFKLMKSRKSYVKSIEEGETLQTHTTFDDLHPTLEDEVYIENSTGKRMLNLEQSFLYLEGGRKIAASPETLLPGIVFKILGSLISENEIKVEQIHLPGIVPIPNQFLPNMSEDNNGSPGIDHLLFKISRGNLPRLAVFAGGLNIDSRDSSMQDVYLLRDLLLDRVGSDLLSSILKCISTVVLTGNQISFETKLNKQLLRSYEYKDNKEKQIESINRNLKAVDELAAALTTKYNVLLMPGQTDVTDCFMPQRAVPSFCFPAAKGSGNFKSASNPAIFDIGEKKFMGTDGSNIQNLLALSPGLKDELDVLEVTLNARHFAPNCPESFPCFPSKSKDPLIIEKGCNVFFCGSSNKYLSKVIKANQHHVKLLAVPRFSDLKSVVLLDLDTLDSYEHAIAI